MGKISENKRKNNIYNEIPFRLFRLKRIVFHYDCLFGKTNTIYTNDIKCCFCEEKDGYESFVVTQNFPMLLEILKYKIDNKENNYCIPELYYNDCKNKIEYKQILNDNNISNIVSDLKKEFGTKYNIVMDIEMYIGKKMTGNVKCKQKIVKMKLTVVDNIKFENVFKVQNVNKNTYHSMIPTIKQFFEKIELSKKISISTIKDNNIQFSRLASVQLLELFLSFFYADNIYSKSSFLSIEDIGSKKIGKIDLISYPYSHNTFDADGIQSKKKYLVHQGVVKNILSNKLYSHMLERNDTGNADLFDANKIIHQRLVLRINEVIPKSKSITIDRCIKIGILKDTCVQVSFLGNYKAEQIVFSCKLNLIEFFQNAKVYDFLFENIEEVLLQNIVIPCADIKKVFSEM